MSYRKFKKYGGLVRYDHKNKLIFQTRELNPPTANARFKNKLRRDHPDYTVVAPKWSKTLTSSTLPSVNWDKLLSK